MDVSALLVRLIIGCCVVAVLLAIATVASLFFINGLWWAVPFLLAGLSILCAAFSLYFYISLEGM